MRINMTFKHMNATEALKQRVNEQSERLTRFAPPQCECHWVLFVDGDKHVADLRVQGPHVDFFAQSKTSDLYVSIEEATDKVEKQLRKHKEIVKDHLHRNNRASD